MSKVCVSTLWDHILRRTIYDLHFVFTLCQEWEWNWRQTTFLYVCLDNLVSQPFLQPSVHQGGGLLPCLSFLLVIIGPQRTLKTPSHFLTLRICTFVWVNVCYWWLYRTLKRDFIINATIKNWDRNLTRNNEFPNIFIKKFWNTWSPLITLCFLVNEII